MAKYESDGNRQTDIAPKAEPERLKCPVGVDFTRSREDIAIIIYRCRRCPLRGKAEVQVSTTLDAALQEARQQVRADLRDKCEVIQEYRITGPLFDQQTFSPIIFDLQTLLPQELQ